MEIKKFVNVFQGTGKSVTPKENTLFSKWNLLKGKAGNLSPSACLPFGSVACSPYSGGYSSGYGNLKVNAKLPPENFFEGDKLIGFSHFTHSGSGAFGFYYNYLVVSPYTTNPNDAQKLKEFDNEQATPGYYSCRLTDEDICCELTVLDKVALHKYTSNKPIKLFVDVSNNGLQQNNNKLYGYSNESKWKVYANGSAGGYVTMQGVRIYFYARCSDSASKQTLFLDGNEMESTEFSFGCTEKRFGYTIETNATSVELKIGFSLVGEERAMANVLSAHDFDIAKKQAQAIWEEKLSAIELDGVSDEEKEIFYSNFYHSLIKPCGWQKESFLWNEKGTFYLDFATLWDVYKTQIPFIFMLYPKVGRDIVKTIIKYGKTQGKLFNALMLSSNQNIEATQACCLACYVLYDAYVCGLVDENQIDDMFEVVKKEVEQYREGILQGTFEKTTKLLDCTLICASFAKLAKELGKKEDEAYFTEIASYWTEAFDKDGLLKTDYPYYEGNHYNYTFRFIRDKEKRIAIAGGKDNLAKQLDKFFAFDESSEMQDRFEGFNNETDMETPYFYHYVGRYDRVCEIADECLNNCFKAGREGLPGNGDSGGLTACYLWNFLGLFPISGQEELFIGKPRARKAKIKLGSGNMLTIINESAGTPSKITFNGNEVTEYTMPVKELLLGGELKFL